MHLEKIDHKGSVLIQGHRINLQPFKVSDAFFMFRNWANDPDVTRYMTWFPHKDIQETESVISMWEEGYSKVDFYQWAILLRQIDEPIGSIGVVEMDEDTKSCELGYCIGKPFWHHVYTSEAVSYVIKFLFEQVKFEKITARHDVRNPNSGAVMMKCGMKYVTTRINIGQTKEGEPLSCAYYEISREEYLANQTKGLK